ncbi:Uncharacterised protein [Mycobacteroides abscessus subsp. abscessus]|nr:Uncharacterised protein [Mycobacteroides abscessus subsp. abscessus]
MAVNPLRLVNIDVEIVVAQREQHRYLDLRQYAGHIRQIVLTYEVPAIGRHRIGIMLSRKVLLVGRIVAQRL